MSLIKVSIIVPVYNVEKYINRCFESIINQRYTNIECIFVDDCSPDNCFEILNQRIAEYSGEIEFRIIRHIQNKGLSEARNSGTYQSSGEYVYYLDSDDEITQDCIQILVRIANKYNGVEIVQGNSKIYPKPNVKWWNRKRKNFPEFTDNKKWIKKHCLIRPRISVWACNKLIKKKFLIENKLFFKEGIVHEDEHWLFYVSKRLSTIAFTEEFCYLHYIVPGSIMQSGSNYRSIESMLEILNEFYSNIDNIYAPFQRKFICKKISSNMLRINDKSSERKFLFGYRTLVKKNLLLSLKSFDIIACFALLILLLPRPFYNNFIGEKVCRLLMYLM